MIYYNGIHDNGSSGKAVEVSRMSRVWEFNQNVPSVLLAISGLSEHSFGLFGVPGCLFWLSEQNPGCLLVCSHA